MKRNTKRRRRNAEGAGGQKSIGGQINAEGRGDEEMTGDCKSREYKN